MVSVKKKASRKTNHKTLTSSSWWRTDKIVSVEGASGSQLLLLLLLLFFLKILEHIRSSSNAVLSNQRTVSRVDFLVIIRFATTHTGRHQWNRIRTICWLSLLQTTITPQTTLLGLSCRWRILNRLQTAVNKSTHTFSLLFFVFFQKLCLFLFINHEKFRVRRLTEKHRKKNIKKFDLTKSQPSTDFLLSIYRANSLSFSSRMSIRHL